MDTEQAASGGFVILGAAGGIGSRLATRLAAAGHDVLLASRPSERLQELGRQLQAPVREVDGTNLEQVEACFAAAAAEAFGRVAGAVNCVGSLLLKPAHLTSDSEWQQTLATNLTSAFATVRAAAKTMTQGGGSVVLMSSAAALLGLPSHEAIAAAKAGVAGLTRSAAASYASRGIRFNAVAPGLVKTELTKKIWASERSAATSRAMHPLGRLGQPDDVASLIIWLLEPTNSWVTGQTFSLDGGLSNIRPAQRPTDR